MSQKYKKIVIGNVNNPFHVSDVQQCMLIHWWSIVMCVTIQSEMKSIYVYTLKVNTTFLIFVNKFGYIL